LPEPRIFLITKPGNGTFNAYYQANGLDPGATVLVIKTGQGSGWILGLTTSTSMTSNSTYLATAVGGVGSLTWLFGALEPAVAGYALRLYHILGRKIGWWVFATFSLLAVGHFFHSMASSVNVFGSMVSFDLLTLLIPFLLLIGMVHAEGTIVARAREGQKEKVLVQEECKNDQQTAEMAQEMEGLRGQVARLAEREKALQASAEQYYLLFTNNPQPMWVFDLRTLQILTVNDAARVQYGFSAQEFMGKSARDLVPSEQMQAFLADVWRPAHGSTCGKIWHQRRKNGSIFEAEVKAMDLKYAERHARLIVANDCTTNQRGSKI
jgi:PAS domain S-box-containing protein